MNVKLNLVILYLDLKTFENGCLLNENSNIVECTLNSNEIYETLKLLLVEYLDVHPNWVKFELVNVVEKEEDLHVIYVCMVPAIIKNKKGAWTRIGNIKDEYVHKMVYEASQRAS
jgi:hypothetical protein